MHSAVILAFKPTETSPDQIREELVENVEAFLDPYYEEEWDWYVIGGRWSGLLPAISIEYMAWSNEFLKQTQADAGESDEYIYSRTVTANLQKLQDKWEALGGTHACPHARDQYVMHGPYDDDILPLSKAIERINEWGEGEFQEYFSFGVSFYDTVNETSDPSTALANGDYWVVMVDMHL